MSPAASSLTANLDVLFTQLPLVRDGEVDAIHDARVATRRLRAALPVLADAEGAAAWDAAAAVLRQLGRLLGSARDLDVSLELLRELEVRAPVVAPATAALRARLGAHQLRHRRKLIKGLEALDLAPLADLAGEAGRRTVRAGRRDVLPRLAAAVAEHAEDLRQKIARASGVYFPNRAHRVRVAIKRTRYAAELIERGAIPDRGLRTFRTAQESLGQLHDREMLAQHLAAASEDTSVPSARELSELLEAESRSLFERYRGLRGDLIDASAALSAWAAAAVTSRRPALGRIGAIALPSAALVLLARGVKRAS